VNYLLDAGMAGIQEEQIPLRESGWDASPADCKISIEDEGAVDPELMQLSQMVDKVLEHKPHSIYFVEGAKALSKESGILKKSLKHIGKNASKCAKKRLKDSNPETFRSFCFHSGADNGGDIREFEELLNKLTSISTETEFVQLPNESQMRCHFTNELLKKFNGPCLKIIVGDFKDITKLILADSGINLQDDRPMLIFTAEKEFHSLMGALKDSPKDMSKFGKEVKALCTKVGIGKEVSKVSNWMKENAWKIDIRNFSKKENLHTLAKYIGLSICRGSNPCVPWLMDSSEEIAVSLASYDRFNRKSSMLVFPNMWKVEGTEKKLNRDLFTQYKSKVNMKKNFPTDKMVFLTSEDLSGNNQSNADNDNGNSSTDKEAKSIYLRMKDRISIENIKKYEDLFPSTTVTEFKEVKALVNSHPVLRFRVALKKNDQKLVRDILSSQALDIYSYLYCNMTNHWKDVKWKKETKVMDYFKLENGCNGNVATSTLTNWVVENIFEEDGRPNLKVATPIQALMVNRLICCQFEVVKVLWRYDKKNSLTNALLLWIMVEGILQRKKKMFKRKHSLEDFQKFKKYFDDAIVELLKSAEKRYSAAYDNPTLSKCRVFNQSRLIDVAGIVEHEHFFTQSLSRRTVAYMWSLEDQIDEDETSEDGEVKEEKKEVPSMAKEENKEITPQKGMGNPEQKGVTSEKKKAHQGCMSPKIKLYIHMIMYLIIYISVAYSTIRWHAKERVAIQWITCVFVISLAVDEARQAIGECGKKMRCLKRWWSDPWNKWDVASMVLYFFAFCVPVNGSRYLFALFSFVWCLKFYQFLRKFKSVGTYIIIVQKMIPHFWNFGLVGLVPLIGYGIFVASLLTTQYDFNSWNTFLHMLLRPYLLLFAETGIDNLKFSKKATLYGTPKIPVFYEIMTILAMCAFMMFGGILLMNLLIAVFGGVYEEVKQKSECLWAINEFELLKEFKKKPQLPVPLSLPLNVWHIIKRLKKSDEKQKSISDKERVESEKSQEKIMNDYLYNEEKSVESNFRLKMKVVEEVDSRMKEIAQKHEKSLDDIKQKLEEVIKSLPSSQ